MVRRPILDKRKKPQDVSFSAPISYRLADRLSSLSYTDAYTSRPFVLPSLLTYWRPYHGATSA